MEANKAYEKDHAPFKLIITQNTGIGKMFT